jgi:hypothetical protein
MVAMMVAVTEQTTVLMTVDGSVAGMVEMKVFESAVGMAALLVGWMVALMAGL